MYSFCMFLHSADSAGTPQNLPQHLSINSMFEHVRIKSRFQLKSFSWKRFAPSGGRTGQIVMTIVMIVMMVESPFQLEAERPLLTVFHVFFFRALSKKPLRWSEFAHRMMWRFPASPEAERISSTPNSGSNYLLLVYLCLGRVLRVGARGV